MTQPNPNNPSPEMIDSPTDSVALILNDIAVMMSEFVDNWPNPKKIRTALELIAKTMRTSKSDDVRAALPLLNKAFRTTTSGPNGYTMEFSFPDLEALHAADDEWHAHRMESDRQCKSEINP